MNENEMYLKLSDKIDKLIDKLDTKFDVFESKLQNHEVRIVVLEQNTPEQKKEWKNEIIMLLVKAVLIGGVSIASLAGAGGIMQKIFAG